MAKVEVVKGGNQAKRRLAEIIRKLTRAKQVRVGFLEGATYPDGTSVPMVAAIQEFGSPANGIPLRPFFRGMVQEKQGGWGKLSAAALKQSDKDVTKALHIVGEVIAGELRESITEFVGVPLSPATIARKGSDKQLVDTGHMLASVDHEVKS